jgi:hypothetical protein
MILSCEDAIRLLLLTQMFSIPCRCADMNILVRSAQIPNDLILHAKP